MWEPTLEVTKVGPLTYQFEIVELALDEKTEYIIQDVDPHDQPVLTKSVGNPSLEFTFPGPGQYRVTVNAWRPYADAPEFSETGRATRILKITEPAPTNTLPNTSSDPDPDPGESARPVISGEGNDQYLNLGLRIVDWLITLEPSTLAAFAAGAIAGGIATYLVLSGGLI